LHAIYPKACQEELFDSKAIIITGKYSKKQFLQFCRNCFFKKKAAAFIIKGYQHFPKDRVLCKIILQFCSFYNFVGLLAYIESVHKLHLIRHIREGGYPKPFEKNGFPFSRESTRAFGSQKSMKINRIIFGSMTAFFKSGTLHTDNK
jgi:hypothetical protein